MIGAVLSWGAVRADAAGGLGVFTVTLDVVTGVVIIVLASTSRRVLWVTAWGLVGLTWLAGSIVPALADAHRGVLVVTIGGLVILNRRPVPTGTWLVLLAIGSALVFPGISPLVAAVLFGLAAVVVARRRGPWRAAAVGSLLLCSAAEVVVALTREGLGPPREVAFAVYSGAIVCAVAWMTSRTKRYDRLLSTMSPSLEELGTRDPHASLTTLLRKSLRDPTARVTAADRPPMSGARVVEVDGAPWATVASSAPWLTDDRTWASVAAVVRRVGDHEALLMAERSRAAQLAASRVRLLDAVDRERAEVASALRHHVVAPLDAAVDELAAWPSIADEVRGAASDVEAVLVGTSPVALGDGGLVLALRALAARSPVAVSLGIPSSLAASRSVEETAYAACAEAVTNALKHARAKHIEIEVEGESTLTLRVRDDGTGGAEFAEGGGLEGLADRVATRGGELRLSSGPIGTTVEVVLPAAPSLALGGAR